MWNFLTPKGRKTTKAFLDHVVILAQNATDRLVDSTEGRVTEKEYLKNLINRCQEYLKQDEWGLVIEELTEGLYEIEFKVDDKAIVLAKDSILCCGMNYEDRRYFEELAI